MKQANLKTLKSMNDSAGRYFFSPETVRFFNSKFHGAWYTTTEDAIYFVESIQPPSGSRIYKVRCMIVATGHVKFTPPDMEFSSARAASFVAKDLAKQDIIY